MSSKVTVYGEKGEVAEVSEMDAREYIASGYYSSTKPEEKPVSKRGPKPKQEPSESE